MTTTREERVERERTALIRVVLGLFALIGLDPSSKDVAAWMPRGLWRAVLSVLRPAEAAARRLVVVLAKDVTFEVVPAVSAPSKGARRKGSAGIAAPGFSLFDPLPPGVPRTKIVSGPGPMVSVPGLLDRPSVPERRETITVKPERMFARMRALYHALGDLERHAKRLARWKRIPFPQRGRFSSIRPGRPAGLGRLLADGEHEVFDILRSAHRLAIAAA